MQLIEPEVQLIEQKPGIDGIYEIIDRIAGICYGREGTHDDSKKFVDGLINRGHMSPLEFGTVYLYLESNESNSLNSVESNNMEMAWLDIVYRVYTKYKDNQFSRAISINDTCKHSVYITTNYRVIIENHWEDDLQYLSEPRQNHAKQYCFNLICSRGIADEFARHRTLSVMMKSTRYCKFDSMEITKPMWVKNEFPNITKECIETILEGNDEPVDVPLKLYLWWYHMYVAQYTYKSMITLGAKPQEARGVLPLDMATNLCLCGVYGTPNKGWNRFFDLRCDNAAHPDAIYLAKQMRDIVNNKENHYKDE